MSAKVCFSKKLNLSLIRKVLYIEIYWFAFYRTWGSDVYWSVYENYIYKNLCVLKMYIKFVICKHNVHFTVNQIKHFQKAFFWLEHCSRNCFRLEIFFFFAKKNIHFFIYNLSELITFQFRFLLISLKCSKVHILCS